MISAIAKSFINTAYVYSLKYFDYAEAYLNLKKQKIYAPKTILIRFYQ